MLNVGLSPGLTICLWQSDISTLIQYGHQLVSIDSIPMQISWTTTTLAISNSLLTQYYCVMSDNLFTLLGGPHQQYLVVFPLNKIVSYVTIY